MHQQNNANQGRALTRLEQQQLAQLTEKQGLSINPNLPYRNGYRYASASPTSSAFSTQSMARSNTAPRSDQPNPAQRRPPMPASQSEIIQAKKSRAMLNPGGLTMNRSVSEHGTPFSGTTRVAPVPRSHNMTSHMGAGFGPVGYMNGHPYQQQWSGRHDMPSLSETGPSGESALIDPEIYLANLSTVPYINNAPACYPTSFTSQPYDENMPFTLQNMSACGSLTSGPTYASDTAPMTRENSLIAGGIDMIHIDSQMSHHSGNSYPPPPRSTGGSVSPLGSKQYMENGSFNTLGSNLSVHSTSPYPELPGDLKPASMERSVSAASSRSSSFRAKETLREQTARAGKTTLAPKPFEDSSDKSSSAKKDGKASIPKTKYVRPRQPRVFCTECTDHPEGFRGDHELRRHRDAKHQAQVKKWVCVDPETRGLPTGVAVVNPLSKCKACKANKKYGAYYNAAAHLRRTHFKEKPSRQKNKRHASAEDRRGGKGGGDWPSMSELKNWMQEVWVDANDDSYEIDDEAEDDGAQHLPNPRGDAPYGAVIDYNYPMTDIQLPPHVMPHGLVITPIGYSSAMQSHLNSPYSSEFGGYESGEIMNHGPYGSAPVPASIAMASQMPMSDFSVEEMGFDMVYPQ